MPQTIIKIAQNSDQIIDNLAETDAKVESLNNELNNLVSQYRQSLSGTDAAAFFDFHNPFFLLTLLGLVLLMIGLWFLYYELRHPSPSQVRTAYRQPEPTAKKTSHHQPQPAVAKAVRTGKKPVKIKVVKVK